MVSAGKFGVQAELVSATEKQSEASALPAKAAPAVAVVTPG